MVDQPPIEGCGKRVTRIPRIYYCINYREWSTKDDVSEPFDYTCGGQDIGLGCDLVYCEECELKVIW